MVPMSTPLAGEEEGAVPVISALENKKESVSEYVTPSGGATSELICSYAPSQSAIVNDFAIASGGSAAAAATIANAAGLSVVAHSSGAYIFTGASGYIAGTLGTAIVGPILVGVGIVVGGAAITVEVLCAPRNHPEFVAKVEGAASDFLSRSKGRIASASTKVAPIAARLKAKVIKRGNDAFAYAKRKSVELSKAATSAWQ